MGSNVELDVHGLEAASGGQDSVPLARKRRESGLLQYGRIKTGGVMSTPQVIWEEALT